MPLSDITTKKINDIFSKFPWHIIESSKEALINFLDTLPAHHPALDLIESERNLYLICLSWCYQESLAKEPIETFESALFDHITECLLRIHLTNTNASLKTAEVNSLDDTTATQKELFDAFDKPLAVVEYAAFIAWHNNTTNITYDTAPNGLLTVTQYASNLIGIELSDAYKDALDALFVLKEKESMSLPNFSSIAFRDYLAGRYIGFCFSKESSRLILPVRAEGFQKHEWETGTVTQFIKTHKADKSLLDAIAFSIENLRQKELTKTSKKACTDFQHPTLYSAEKKETALKQHNDYNLGC